MAYYYRGKDSQGAFIEGEIQGPNEKEVLAELKRRQITPTKISLLVDTVSWIESIEHYLPKKRVDIDDLIMFCRQMYALTKSGLPVMRSIKGLTEHAKNKLLKEALIDVNKNLINGNTLAASLSSHDRVFSDLFVSMIHMGETTGRLDTAFLQLVDHLELEKDTKKKIKSATSYPIMVTVSMLVAILTINIFVVPEFESIFRKLGGDLPIPTIILMTSSDFIRGPGIHLVWIFAIAAYAWWRYTLTPKGALLRDKLKLKLPFVGKIFERIMIGRFARPFSMMLEAGVPLLQALSVSARTVGNDYIGSKISTMHHGIERGESLVTAAANTQIFNPLIIQMIGVGEETGRVSELLLDVADFYDQEVEYDLKRLAESIEPVLLLFMGGMVLLLALGVFLPMWDLSSNI